MPISLKSQTVNNQAMEINVLSPVDRLFSEFETSFGVIAKISDEELKAIQGNMNLSSENRARVDYEIRTRNIQLPNDWKL